MEPAILHTLSEVKTIMPLWTWLVPVLALGALLISLLVGVAPWLALLCGVALAGAVFVAVHHAEVVAHRVGEPFGTLILALAVTAIEAALILSMMVAGGQDMAVLARDSIYDAVMIICTGVVGLCLLLGGLAHCEQTFRVEGGGSRVRCIDRHGGADAGLACVYHQRAQCHLQHGATRIRGSGLGGALGDLCLRSDGASSRLFHSDRKCFRH